MVVLDGCYIGIKVYVMVVMIMIEYICGVFKDVVEEVKNMFGDNKVNSVNDFFFILEFFFFLWEIDVLK